MTWAHLIVAGIALDIAGAVVVAWTLSASSAEKISKDIPIIGMSFGLPQVALGAAHQRAEARLGIAFLVGGFLLQAIAYFFPHPTSNLDETGERVIGALLMVAIWVAALAAYRVYVPWSAKRIYAKAHELQSHAEEQPAPQEQGD